MTYRKLILAALLASASTAQAVGQTPESMRPPPSPSEAPASVGRNPSVTSLMQAYNLSEEEAAERITLQGDIIELTNRIRAEKDIAFAGVDIEHQPQYRVVISFADNKDRKGFIQEIPPRLRRYVALRVVKRSREQTRNKQKELAPILQKAGQRFITGYDRKTDSFVIDVESEAAASALRALVPADVAADVRFNVAPLPKEQAPPTGVQPGDWASAGYTVWTTTGYTQPCTLAFPVRFGPNQKQGILTAGHCDVPKYLNINNHWVTLTVDGTNRYNHDWYDYAIYETTGMNTDYQLFYRDKNAIPEFDDAGWLHTKNIIREWNQVNGFNVCKQGETTGITCGTIVDDSYPYRPGYWFIKVSQSKQRLISDYGDSGGPWFLYTDPRSSKDITAAGIHTSGNFVTGTAGTSVYMPVDRVFDHNAVNLILKP